MSRKLKIIHKGICIKCSEEFSGKYKGAKYCSAKCRSSYIVYKYRVKTGKIKNPGVGSGGNQWGKDNHQYKFGIGTYHKLAFDNLPHKCNRCSSKEKLLVHHIDHNRKNNTLENLEILCKRCHQNHHAIRDEFGKFKKQK